MGNWQDKLSDVAGRFPVSDGAGSHHRGLPSQNARRSVETDRRIQKELADQITKVFQQRKEGWSFAAPARFIRPLSIFCRPPRGTGSSNM